MSRLSLKCRCGTVAGYADHITPKSGNRVVCCCCDCQKFASFLDQETLTLDEFGGTDIYQTSQSQVKISQGVDKLRVMRLSETGLLRWYTDCCKTAVGNMVSAKMPLVGLIHSFVDDVDFETKLGPVRAYIQTQHAKGEPNYPHHSAKFPPGIILRMLRKMLVWKLQGKQNPSVFVGDDGRTITKPIIARPS